MRTRGPWYRVYRSERDPIHFGRAGLSRFADPFGRYGVLDAADALEGALIETFGRGPGVNVVRESQLARRSMVLIEADRPLRLVVLTGPGLAQIGAANALMAGPHAVARR